MNFTGTKRLVRLALRRDRIVLPITIILAVIMVGGSAPALTTTYPDYKTQLAYISSSAPSLVGRVFQGTVQGVNLGSIVMAETYMTAVIIMAVMSIFIISRHTRYNEETGAGELLGSTRVGRYAPLTAALFVAIGANIVTGFLILLSLLPISQLSQSGSAMLALSLVSVGVFFAGISAITVQLSNYRRGANGLAIGTLIAFFVIRSFGDAFGSVSADGFSVTTSWLGWLSPLGWGYQVLPYNGNHFGPILLLLGGFLITISLAYWLLAHRDVGSSIFQQRLGRARAKPRLLSAFGLANRLQYPSLLAWGAGFVISGWLTAILINDFRETFQENETFQQFLATTGGSGNFADRIVSAMFTIMAAMLAGYIVTAVSKIQDEEISGRLEYLMGTALSRIRWLLSHVFYIAGGVFASLLAMGVAGALAYDSSAVDSTIGFFDLIIAALISLPAMLLFLAIVVGVFSVAGHFVKTFAWSFYAYCAMIGSLAGIFGWPQWTSNFSPFVHTPAYPSNEFRLLPLLLMSALAGLLLLVAIKLFTRRDLVLK